MTEDVNPQPDGEDEVEGDELSTVGLVAKDVLDRAAEQLVDLHDARMVAGFVMIVADGVKPNGGMWFEAAADGPQDPDDRVAFMLRAVQAFAEQQGVPIALIDTSTN